MINVILISLIFGISQKLADAVNEHGTVLFKGANIFFWNNIRFLWLNPYFNR
jgi:hypothetical protein